MAPRTKKNDAPTAPLWEGRLTRADLLALRGAEMHVGRDDTRPALQNVCIDPDGTLVATDTHRLYRYRGSSVRPPSRALLAGTMFAALRHASNLEGLHLTLSREGATLRHLGPDGAIAGQFSEGPIVTRERFPDYERIFPSDWRIQVTFTVRDLLIALEELARFDAFLATSAVPDGERDETRVTLGLHGPADAMVLVAGAAREAPATTQWVLQTEVPATVSGLTTGDAFVIALNRHYLRDCPRALQLSTTERLTLRFNEPLLPIGVESPDAVGATILVMPMQRFPSDPAVTPPRRR